MHKRWTMSFPFFSSFNRNLIWTWLFRSFFRLKFWVISCFFFFKYKIVLHYFSFWCYLHTVLLVKSIGKLNASQADSWWYSSSSVKRNSWKFSITWVRVMSFVFFFNLTEWRYMIPLLFLTNDRKNPNIN